VVPLLTMFRRCIRGRRNNTLHKLGSLPSSHGRPQIQLALRRGDNLTMENHEFTEGHPLPIPSDAVAPVSGERLSTRLLKNLREQVGPPLPRSLPMARYSGGRAARLRARPSGSPAKRTLTIMQIPGGPDMNRRGAKQATPRDGSPTPKVMQFQPELTMKTKKKKNVIESPGGGAG
jgi:hypothetical protein